MRRFAAAIDRFTEATAIGFAALLLPLAATVAWEVVARYGFDAPTTWAYETIYTLYAAMFMLGAAYALRVGAHVRTDFLWEKWPARRRAAIETLGYALFFLPGMALFFAAGIEWAWASYALGERSADTAWFPPLWPLKAILPASSALLFLQGLAQLAKSIHAWRTGEAL